MTGENGTEEEPAFPEHYVLRPRRGLLLLVENGLPTFRPYEIAAPLLVGRDPSCAVSVGDRSVSGRHFEVSSSADGTVVVRDLASANGTVVDGALVKSSAHRGGRVIRAGRSLFCLVDDVSRYIGANVTNADGRVIGPTQRAALDAIELAARSSSSLVIIGESGTGKEGAARAYHAASPKRRGPFVAVNCGGIAAHLAEGLFFGARRGAYSGADRDQEGYVGAALGGVLFLDEIGEFPLELQPKLLRVLETGDYNPLGVSQARHADLCVCAATNVDLFAAADRGAFRRDLLMRLARRVVRLPPLRDRPEEVPFLVAGAVGDAARNVAANPLPISTRVFEICLLRTWADENVRGLRNVIEQAYETALGRGASALDTEHTPFAPSVAAQPPVRGTSASVPPAPEEVRIGSLIAAYYEHQGNVAAAARAVGTSRATAYRLLAQAGVRFRRSE